MISRLDTFAVDELQYVVAVIFPVVIIHHG